MKSAYAVHDASGAEPDFTNYARIKEDDPFIDTLDYIFLGDGDNSGSNSDGDSEQCSNNHSDSWKVKSVKELPHRDDAGGPFPNLDHGEPSDHIMIAADLEL